MKIVISEFIHEPSLERFGPGFDIVYDPALVDDRDRLCRQLGDADALIVRNRTKVDAALLSSGQGLRAIGRLGVGLDNIDLETCATHRISVFPATGANTLSVAEYVIGTAMVLLRGAYGAGEAMIAGRWPRQALMGRELSGRTLGLVGFGEIARMTAQKAEALGMEIAAFDPFIDADDPVWRTARRHDTLPALLGASDVVSLHVPLTDATKNLIGAEMVGHMAIDAVLINTSRGGIVDEAAVAAALVDGRLAGAALDVFAEEPLAGAAATRFVGIPNLILTPHIAGVTTDANIRVSNLTVDNVKRALAADA